MIERISEYIAEHHMIESGDIVCAGVSGGKDSVCMLIVLSKLCPVFDFELRAFHVEHGLRGEDSRKDRLFVENLCREMGIPLDVFEHDVGEFANRIKTGTEEAGRILRLRDAQICLENGCTKIALAHHKNDQAETFLFHLARGCSVFGMAGIRPVNDKIIHPMLAVSGEETEAFLRRSRIVWRTDQTNYDTAYTRNFIRHELIPLMEKRINASASAHIASAAEDMILAERIIKEAVQNAFDRYVTISDTQAFVSADLMGENALIIRSVLISCMERLALSRKDISRIHAEETKKLFSSPTGRSVSLPYGLLAESSYGNVIIRKIASNKISLKEVPFIPGETVKMGPFLITSEVVNGSISEILKKNKYTKCFDYDKIRNGCVFRTRRPGDFLLIDGGSHTKKLKDYYIDWKIPRYERDSFLLLAAGNTVHWVLGLRMGDSAKVTENTRQIVKITYYREENNGN